MKLYNTLTRGKQEFVPIKEGEVKIYACGPTVYDYIHVGNARMACVFDVLRRYLEYRGYRVTFALNYTDVDDKIINRAKNEGVEFDVISRRFIDEYVTDTNGLGILPATVNPRVSENMDGIIEIISILVQKGYAYVTDGDVWFETGSFAEYGKLSGMPLEELEAGARIEIDEQKKNPTDFALWKAAKPGEPYWDSPWGKGRPGWHIECSAMARRYLGDTIDIHCGGQDLIFPHHENEIAQSECANGVKFANYWVHNGHVNIENKKMAKSKGNFFTVREAAQEFGYEPLRFMLISSHYRSPMNYSAEIINQSRSAMERMRVFKDKLNFAIKTAGSVPNSNTRLLEITDECRNQFIAAMEDDCNTADAIAAIFSLIKDVNIILDGGSLPEKSLLEATKSVFDELCGVLGIMPQEEEQDIADEVEELVKKRTQARQDKDYSLADSLRDQINALGYIIEETKQGTRVVKR
ncbi:MAG: cysteine--tRNA ligase [Oscillospiraceae bacterium]|nr:cysteine--tRNA ligase [Oscillospiraceae bacterium]